MRIFTDCSLSCCRYDFVPPVKYDYLNEDEAEKRFEQRHKTLNYFSVMLSRRLREEEEGGEGVTAAGGGKKKNVGRKAGGDLVRRYIQESGRVGGEGREGGVMTERKVGGHLVMSQVRHGIRGMLLVNTL